MAPDPDRPRLTAPAPTDTARIPASSMVMLAVGMIGLISFLLVFTWQAPWFLWLIPAACAIALLARLDRAVRSRRRAREELDAQYGRPAPRR